MNAQAEQFFEKSKKWNEEYNLLREIILENKSLEEDSDSKQKAVINALSNHVPKFVKVISKQLKSKSATVRLQCFSLLTSLLRYVIII